MLKPGWIFVNLLMFALLSFSPGALAQQAPQPSPPHNQYPPGEPTPPTTQLPPDDTIFYVADPKGGGAPQMGLRAGYAGFKDNAGTTQAAGIGAVIFLEGGRTGLVLNANYVGGQNGPFAYAEGDLKFRFRVPIDPAHIIWGGFGANIGGRGASDPHIDSYLRIQPTAFVGVMRALKQRDGNVACVFHAFAKAGVGIFDNQTQSVKKWEWPWGDQPFDSWVRPSVGAELAAYCAGGSFQVVADGEHIFTLGLAGNTDRATLELSKTWRVSDQNNFQIGFFGRGEGVLEHGASGLPAGDPNAQSRTILRSFAGLEVRFW